MSVRHVGIRCDAGPTQGVGHLSRCIALAEEIQQRGGTVEICGDVGGVPWAERLLASHHLSPLAPTHTPEALASLAEERRWDAVILDSYELDPACAGAVRRSGRPTVAIVDGDTRGQHADLFVDQNLGADLAAPTLPAHARRLAGLRYVLLRDSVRRRRPTQPPVRTALERPRVVAFFGGTDPFGAAEVVVPLVLATGVACSLTVVAARDGTARALESLSRAPGQDLRVIHPTDDLPALVAGSDLVVSASGTSLWELLCLGVPAAVIWVVDNQELGYRAVTAAGLAVGLGRLGELATDPQTRQVAETTLADLLRDPLQRTSLAERGWHAVDGRGRVRVVDALDALDALGPG